jgi:hypothetical protein
LLTTNINLGELKLNFGVDECFKWKIKKQIYQ